MLGASSKRRFDLSGPTSVVSVDAAAPNQAENKIANRSLLGHSGIEETAGHRWTSTGILQCVRTLTVSLPRTIAEMPWRPCDAITIRSQPFKSAVSIIAW